MLICTLKAHVNLYLNTYPVNMTFILIQLIEILHFIVMVGVQTFDTPLIHLKGEISST
jgi:hypothetical protein